MSEGRRAVSYDQLEELTDRIVEQIRATRHEYDVILGVARGGLHLALNLSHVFPRGRVLTCHLRRYPKDAMDSEAMPVILDFPVSEKLAGLNVLVADECWQKGHTNIRVLQEVAKAEPRLLESAVWHFKPEHNCFPRSKPTFFAEETSDWIDYPWELYALRHTQLV